MKGSKINIGIATCLLSGMIAGAQTIATDLETGDYTCLPYAVSVNNKLNCFLVERRTIHLFAYDTMLKMIKQQDFDLSKTIGNSNIPMEVTALNGKPALFFADKDWKEFSYALFNTDDYTIEKNKLPAAEKHENYLGCFSANDHFYIMFLAGKKDFSLDIEDISFPLQITRHNIPLSALNLADPAQKGIPDMFLIWDPIAFVPTGVRLQKVRPEGRITNYTAQSTSKFYYSDSALTIVLNNAGDTTQVLTIGLKYFNYNLRKIPSANRVCDGNINTSCNSFLLDNKVFYVNVCPDNLVFEVYDAAGGQPLKQFATAKKGTLDYMNGPFYKLMNGQYNNKAPVAEAKETTKDIINTLSDKSSATMNLGVGGFINQDGLIELTIGASEDARQGLAYYPFFPMLNMPHMGSMPVMGGFRALFPALIWSNSLNNMGLGKRNYFFKVYLDRNTLQPITAVQKSDKLELLDNAVGQVNAEGQTDGAGSIMFNGKMLIYYYVRKYEQFLLKVFDADKK